MIKVLKQFELWRFATVLTLVCLTLYFIFSLIKNSIVRTAFPNEILVTAQGVFDKKTVVIKMLTESVGDTLVIYHKGKSVLPFRPYGYTQFFVFQEEKLIADFEHIKEDKYIGSTYHFFLSANEDYTFMDMRVE
ncbi:MAG: hypothetical protein AAF519_02545 [Bacteroidota bacterium]